MAQWKLKEESMITVGLIKHLGTGKILIMALASVGIKSLHQFSFIRNYESSTSIISIYFLSIL